MKAFVLATGPSLTQFQVARVAGHGTVFAISDAYHLAPWADFLVSTDRAWWYAHPEAMQFAGRKFSVQDYEGVERVPGLPSGMNSGLVALRLAVMLGATTVVLLGMDMRGTHFFGPHTRPLLTNTSEKQFDDMKRQFADFQPNDVRIVNATLGSALTCYPRVTLDEML